MGSTQPQFTQKTGATEEQVKDPHVSAGVVLLVGDHRLVAALSAEVVRLGLAPQAVAETELAAGQSEAKLATLAIVACNPNQHARIAFARMLTEHKIPVIGIIEGMSADFAKTMIESGASSVLMMPVSTEQIALTITTTLRQHSHMNASRAVLDKDRAVSVAVGILMTRLNIDEHSAFEHLRAHSRASRRRLHDVAADLLQLENDRSNLYAAIAAKAKRDEPRAKTTGDGPPARSI